MSFADGAVGLEILDAVDDVAGNRRMCLMRGQAVGASKGSWPIPPPAPAGTTESLDGQKRLSDHVLRLKLLDDLFDAVAPKGEALR